MKKNIPLAALESIRAVLAQYGTVLRAEHPEGAVAVFREKEDSGSPFVFRFKKAEPNGSGALMYHCTFTPGSRESVTETGILVEPKDFERYFSLWVGYLDAYNQPHPLFDDLIVQSYYEELETLFVASTDADADTRPYSLAIQAQLDAYYDRAVTRVQGALGEKYPEAAAAITQEIEEARDAMSQSTKNQVLNRIHKFAARAYKYSREVGNDLMKDLLIEVIKKGLSDGAMLLLG